MVAIQRGDVRIGSNQVNVHTPFNVIRKYLNCKLLYDVPIFAEIEKDEEEESDEEEKNEGDMNENDKEKSEIVMPINPVHKN